MKIADDSASIAKRLKEIEEEKRAQLELEAAIDDMIENYPKTLEYLGETAIGWPYGAAPSNLNELARMYMGGIPKPKDPDYERYMSLRGRIKASG